MSSALRAVDRRRSVDHVGSINFAMLTIVPAVALLRSRKTNRAVAGATA
jgi:hypothetical protein